MKESLAIIIMAAGALIFLYMAGRMITAGILRSLQEKKRKDKNDG